MLNVLVTVGVPSHLVRGAPSFFFGLTAILLFSCLGNWYFYFVSLVGGVSAVGNCFRNSGTAGCETREQISVQIV